MRPLSTFELIMSCSWTHILRFPIGVERLGRPEARMAVYQPEMAMPQKGVAFTVKAGSAKGTLRYQGFPRDSSS